MVPLRGDSPGHFALYHPMQRLSNEERARHVEAARWWISRRCSRAALPPQRCQAMGAVMAVLVEVFKGLRSVLHPQGCILEKLP